MKKTIFLLLICVFLYACNKDSASPNIAVVQPQQQPATEYYPRRTAWLYVEGDTLFKDTLILTHSYSEHEMTETSTATYDFSFSIWQNVSISFIGKLKGNYSIILSNPGQTKSVTYKLLN